MKERLGKMGRWIWIILAVIVGAVLIYFFLIRGRANANTSFQTSKAEQGTLTATVGATGTVRARQSAILLWQAAGIVDSVNVEVGDPVQKDAVLATLEKTSLPQNVILAEADLVSAQEALEDLLKSDTARAKAIITLRDARDAYERALEYRDSLNGKIDLQRITYVTIGGRQIPQIKYYKGYAGAEATQGG
jgi:multidrug efflux pump subunit AcrA (membrane-fusion protein)